MQNFDYDQLMRQAQQQGSPDMFGQNLGFSQAEGLPSMTGGAPMQGAGGPPAPAAPAAPAGPNAQAQQQMILDYLMGQGAGAPQRDAIAQKRAMVNLLRQGGKMPGMRQAVGGGGLIAPQTAANPLEFLGAAAQSGMGEYQNRQADQMQKEYGAQSRADLEALRRRMGGGA